MLFLGVFSAFPDKQRTRKEWKIDISLHNTSYNFLEPNFSLPISVHFQREWFWEFRKLYNIEKDRVQTCRQTQIKVLSFFLKKSVCFLMVFYNRDANFTERETYSSQAVQNVNLKVKWHLRKRARNSNFVNDKHLYSQSNGHNL